jgi:hypothetical protein
VSVHTEECKRFQARRLMSKQGCEANRILRDWWIFAKEAFRCAW